MKTLRQFLTEEKALDKFCTNVIVQQKKDRFYQDQLGRITPDRMDKIIDAFPQSPNIIDILFRWDESPQGQRYWERLHDTWKNDNYKGGYIHRYEIKEII